MKRINNNDCKEIRAAGKLQDMCDENSFSIPFPFFKYVQNDLALIILAELWDSLKKYGHPIEFDGESFRERHKCTGELHSEIKFLQTKGFINTKRKLNNEPIWKIRLNLKWIKKIFKESV